MLNIPSYPHYMYIYIYIYTYIYICINKYIYLNSLSYGKFHVEACSYGKLEARAENLNSTRISQFVEILQNVKKSPPAQQLLGIKQLF